MTAAPGSVGPQNGSPPSLEFVPLDRLNVDAAYQRATEGQHSRRIIAGMVKCWEWPLCQPLVAARRHDGTLWVLDGQHRLAGARASGDIQHLPCVVLPALAPEDEARAFVDLNTRRQKLSQTDIFNGRLAAGDSDAKATAALLARTGWRIVRSSATDGWKPGDLVCAPMIVNQRRIHGEQVVEAALITLRSAYPTEVVTAPANLLQALVQLYKPGGAFEGLDTAGVAKAMGKTRPSLWIGEAARLRAKTPDLSVVTAIAVAITKAAGQSAAPAVKVLSTSPPAAITRTNASNPPVFGTTGKGWCDQCEQLVSRERAKGCASNFCRMKLAA